MRKVLGFVLEMGDFGLDLEAPKPNRHAPLNFYELAQIHFKISQAQILGFRMKPFLLLFFLNAF